MSVPNKVRLDKWLWSIRIFKTRTLATEACRSGRVKVSGKSVKASHGVEVGDIFQIKLSRKTWLVRAEKLIQKRVGAVIAKTCFEDLSPEPTEDEKIRAFFYKPTEVRDRGIGRPTKKDRRTLDDFKDGE